MFSNINSAFQYFLTYEMLFLTVNSSKRKNMSQWRFVQIIQLPHLCKSTDIISVVKNLIFIYAIHCLNNFINIYRYTNITLSNIFSWQGITIANKSKNTRIIIIFLYELIIYKKKSLVKRLGILVRTSTVIHQF